MSDEWLPIVDGFRRRTVALTAHMMQIIVRMDQGSILPEHHHPHEQITHLISGRLRFTLSGETFECGPGDSVAIPGNAPHGVTVLEQAVALDTFSPPREDMLAQDRAARGNAAS